MSDHPDLTELKRGQRAIDSLIGAKIIDAHASQGAVTFELAHRGCDDDACQITVPLSGIHFWDEEEPA